MATKRYYWLKLEENFFKSPKIKILMNMQDGYKFIVLYLKMMLTAINSDGKLLLDEGVPYDAETLAIVLDMNIEDVSAALDAIKSLGLIKIKDDVISITNFEDIVGSETADAKRKRLQKASKNGIFPNISGNFPIEIEKDKEIDKEKYIDIEIEREKEEGGAHNLAPHSEKTDFSDKSFSVPTSEEVALYAKERGSSVDTEKFYDHYTAVGWMMGGSPMKDWRAAFRKWEKSERPAVSAAPDESGKAPKEKSGKGIWRGRAGDELDYDPEALMEKSSSFDTEDFFEAALRRSYGENYDNIVKNI